MKKLQLKQDVSNALQWGTHDGESFFATGATVKTIGAGLYRMGRGMQGPVLGHMDQVTDTLIKIPSKANSDVIDDLDNFWQSREDYEKHSLIYKRGILLHGPPGGGKTATIAMITKHVIDNCDGIVLLVNDVYLASEVLLMVRKLEPDRPILGILEDVNKFIDNDDDAALTALLDGETQVNNVVFLATTNYFDSLPIALTSRPSRFDEVILVDMPDALQRKTYLTAVATELAAEVIDQWVADTDGYSLAHLKELFIAVVCLRKPYAKTVERLDKMIGRKKVEPKPPVAKHTKHHENALTAPIDSAMVEQ